ncbi:MAG: hypothetical protein HDR13_08235 [Lachnospiraceae bacterium]|nr:hypothetical protein [Lachnospiraceae bacterium]
MKGIGVGGGTGIVKGTLNSISYSRSYKYSQEYYQEDDFNIWWQWINKGTPYEDKTTVGYSTATNLQGVMSALTGTKEEKRNGIDSTPGLLTNGTGATPYGGTISMHFALTSEQAYTYGKDNQSSKDVGDFWISITVDQNDKTEQDVLDKITAALNANTILDFDKNSATSDNHHIWSADEITHKIDVPIYGGMCGFYVQAGTEGGQHIEVKYEALSTIALGMRYTNVRTAESAQRAINEVKGALQMVSEQRSTFGAYQNRIEHAQNINSNVEENTQSAESLIRDTDIADTMMEYSINNILMQAGISMLTQANQSSQSILELLQ